MTYSFADYIRLTAITYQSFGLNKKRQVSEETCLFLVRMSGLEPPTPCMSSKYSDQLSYTLKCLVMLSHKHKLVKRIRLPFYTTVLIFYSQNLESLPETTSGKSVMIPSTPSSIILSICFSLLTVQGLTLRPILCALSTNDLFTNRK